MSAVCRPYDGGCYTCRGDGRSDNSSAEVGYNTYMLL